MFRYGENEWQELLLDGEDEQTYIAGGYSFHPSRTAYQLALKWNKVKALMQKDLKLMRS